MQLEGALRAVQMLSADVANLTSNLALTKGQLDFAREVRAEIDPFTWGEPPEKGEGTPCFQVPLPQYQAILRLLDALS